MACTAIAVSDWPERAPWGTPPKFRVRHGVASLQGLLAFLTVIGLLRTLCSFALLHH
jgi:hypothetical protein